MAQDTLDPTDPNSELMKTMLARQGGTATSPTASPTIDYGQGATINYTDPNVRDAGGATTPPSPSGWWDQAGGTSPAPPAAPANTGTGIPWTTGSSQPSYSPPGYTWDADQARFVPTAANTTNTAFPQNEGDWQGWFSQLTNGKPPTPAQLTELEPQIVAAGGKVLRNAQGVAGKIQLPSGKIIDVIQSAGTGGVAWQWLDGGAGGGAAGGGTGPAGLAQSNWTPDPRSGQLFDLLMQRATQGLNVDRNTPVIRQQSDAFAAQDERNRRNYLSQVAEQGGPNANIAAETRASAETVGQQTGAFEGQLLAQELSARRTEIAQDLSLYASQLSDTQRMQLQQQLAIMDNALQQAQLAQGSYQFDVNDEFRRSPLASGTR